MRPWRRVGHRTGPARRPGRQSGATVVETILVLAALSIVVRVGGHFAGQWWLAREAAEIVEAVRTVDEAARQIHRTRGPERLEGAPLGEVPDGLTEALPEGFAFQRPAFELGWSYWTLGDSLGPLIQGDGLGSVTVRIPDPKLQSIFLYRALPSLLYRTEDSFTFLVTGL